MDETRGLDEGISLYNEKNYTDALSFFLSLPSDSYADSIEVAYYVGLCYAKLKRYDDALLYLEQVVTAEGADTDEKGAKRVLQCRYLLAVIYCLTGRTKLADFELNKLLELGYKKASAYASLAYIAWQEDDVDKCIAYYQQALAYGLSGNKKEKVKVLSRVTGASADSPLYSEAMYELGRAYMEVDDNQQAVKTFGTLQTATSDNTYAARALIGRGMAFRNMKNYEQALSEYKQVVDLLPQSEYAEEALMAINSIYQTTSQPEKFLEYMQSRNLSVGKTPKEQESIYFNTAE
ncbi:MAG: tetratricopeptide repeat protein, partial [Treponema sp.]|nr:tetratricopeptide repeat protein [Treponema sp.]